MKKIISIFILYILTYQIVMSQNDIRISGFVKDKNSGDVLIGATIIDRIKLNGSYSDNNGYFSFIINTPCTLKFSYIGYSSFDTIISSTSNVFVLINLDPNISLEEVEITAKPILNANINTLKINELENMPSLGGRIDIGRAMQSLPGISGQKEGSSTLLVRGGDPGQNMYLFDNVPILYVNHLAGFFSVFNPDIINGIDVYKGDFPSKFGGKIS